MLHPFPGGPWHRQQDGSLTWCPAPPGVACSVILMYTFCTDCWLIAVLYFTWLAFDWNTPKKGNLSRLPPVSPTPQEAPVRLQPLLLGAAPFFTEHLLCERPGLGCVWLGVGGLKLPRCLHRGAHLSLGMAGGMYVGRGTLGSCKNAVWADRCLPQGFTLALSLLCCSNVPHSYLRLPNTVFCFLEGGRRSQWVRNWAVWRYFRDYFPIQVKT